MLYLLITIIVQNGNSQVLFTEYITQRGCISGKKEALMHDFGTTRVHAFCIKQEK